MNTLTEDQYNTLQSAGFTKRQIAEHEVKFVNLFAGNTTLTWPIEGQRKIIESVPLLRDQRDRLLSVLKLVMPALLIVRKMHPRSKHDDSFDVVENAQRAIDDVEFCNGKKVGEPK